MSLIEANIALNLDSAYGEEVYDNGSRFRTYLNPALELPDEAIGIEVSVPSANIWYSFVNLGDSSGSEKFKFSFRGTAYEYDIPKGRYDLSAVQTMMNRAVAVNNVDPGDRELFAWEGDATTGKAHLSVYAQDSSATTIVDFTGSDTLRLRTLLGYDASGMTFSGLASPGYNTIIPSDPATFSALSYVTINQNLITSGYDPRGGLGSAIATVTPDVSVGSLIKYAPAVPLKYDGSILQGRQVDTLELSLLDSSGLPVDTNGETWNLRLNIRYFMPWNES